MRRFAIFLTIAAAAITLAGCTSPNGTRGIVSAMRQQDPELQRLGQSAMRGDKNAQLELGIRYEEGVGVPVDLAAAEGLYRMAAEPVSGTIYIYSPGVGRARGTVMPVTIGPDVPGLPEAAKRRDRLRDARRAAEASRRRN